LKRTLTSIDPFGHPTNLIKGIDMKPETNDKLKIFIESLSKEEKIKLAAALLKDPDIREKTMKKENNSIFFEELTDPLDW
jgi:hypothetical protein